MTASQILQAVRNDFTHHWYEYRVWRYVWKSWCFKFRDPNHPDWEPSYTHLTLPPSLIEALGDLAKPLFTQNHWIPPEDVIHAVHMLGSSKAKHATEEDVQLFLNWAQTAITEAALEL